jgi:hypothetical protein
MAAFPTLNNGIVTQIPYTTVTRFTTTRNDLECGKRIAYAEKAASVRRWQITYGAITDTELATLQAFWASVKGGWDTFDYTDPNTGNLLTARFGQDDFTWQDIGKNQHSLTLTLDEFV